MNKTNKPFLSRWSQRKNAQKSQLDQNVREKQQESDKGYLESELPKQNESSTIPVWLQEDCDPDIKKRAFSALFKQTEFKHIDHLNDYDEDYTDFTDLGDVVTHEMKRMLKLAEQQDSADFIQHEHDKNHLAEKHKDSIVEPDEKDDKHA